MREIKFRGWHSQMKRMFSAEEMAVDQMTLLPTGQFINCHSNVKLSTIYPTDKFIPLQFTGLKDKNGKEIYEGDIVGVVIKTTSHHGDDFIKSVVEYKDGRFQAKFWDDGSTWVEVIGNIYENPELLEPPLGNNAEPVRNISEDDWRLDDR